MHWHNWLGRLQIACNPPACKISREAYPGAKLTATLPSPRVCLERLDLLGLVQGNTNSPINLAGQVNFPPLQLLTEIYVHAADLSRFSLRP